MQKSVPERRLLMIAYKFPPMQSVSCRRTWALCQGFKDYFSQVFVLSTSNRHKLLQDPVDVPDVSVTDAWTFDYRTAFQKEGRAAVVGEKTKSSRFGRILAKLQSSFPTMPFLGEGSVFYIRNGIAAGSRLIRKHQITHLFSTFPPYADHLIAVALKKRFPHLEWIADFRDLHVDPAQDNLYWRGHQINKNRGILKHAEVVTTVSRGLAAHLRTVHDNVQVLRNGIRALPAVRVELYPEFTISYTGSMFQDKRRPETLLEALQNLIQHHEIDSGHVVLQYAGKDSAVWHTAVRQFGLDRIFHDRGLISGEEANTMQMRSHINLVLTYSTSELKGNLTGKLYDCLASGRFTLVLINGPRDTEIEELIATAGNGAVVYHGEAEKLTQVLRERYQNAVSDDEKKISVSSSRLASFTWDAQIAAFAEYNHWPQRTPVSN